MGHRIEIDTILARDIERLRELLTEYDATHGGQTEDERARHLGATGAIAARLGSFLNAIDRALLVAAEESERPVAELAAELLSEQYAEYRATRDLIGDEEEDARG